MKQKLKRRCIGCGRDDSKDSFIRSVRMSDGSVIVPADAKAQGRGAYVCRDLDCIRRARKRNALARTLRCAVDLSVYDHLEELCR